jgi:two-component system, NarL family, nitrate/nitrite response regulator NarL
MTPTERRRAKIIVADQEPHFSAALSEALREEGHRCELVTTSEALLKHVEDEGPDLVVADVALFDDSDANVLERLRKRTDPPSVVIVTARPSLESAIRAVNTGVAAYLVKPVDPSVVLEVVDNVWHLRRVSTASSVLGPLATPAELERGFERCMAALAELRQSSGRLLEASPRLRLEAHPEIETLSPREREVLEHIVSGHRVPTIARDLFISPHTVRNHLKSIFQKIGVGSQVELVEWLQRRP